MFAVGRAFEWTIRIRYKFVHQPSSGVRFSMAEPIPNLVYRDPVRTDSISTQQPLQEVYFQIPFLPWVVVVHHYRLFRLLQSKFRFQSLRICNRLMHLCIALSNMTRKDGDQTRGDTYSDASPFVRLLRTPSRVKIIDVLLGKHYESLTSREIAELADIDRSSVTRNIPILEDIGLVEQAGKVGNAPRYQLNTESEVAKALGRAQANLLDQSANVPNRDSTDTPLFGSDGAVLPESDSPQS